MSVTAEIKKRISDIMPGDIIMTSDFSYLSNITTVRKCLGRCVEEGIIRRVFDGIYEKPKYSDFLKETMPTNPEKVAYAIAEKNHWTIAPCGDFALNKLGLTTQVPAVWSYISDGPYRDYSWDNIQLRFKHKANREISLLSPQTVLVIEAIRALGKERITPDIIIRLRNKLPDNDKKLILVEATAGSEWIYETIRKVCIA